MKYFWSADINMLLAELKNLNLKMYSSNKFKMDKKLN